MSPLLDRIRKWIGRALEAIQEEYDPCTPKEMPRPICRFATGQGSLYEVEGRRTRRWKREESWKEQPPSDRTVYVAREEGDLLQDELRQWREKGFRSSIRQMEGEVFLVVDDGKRYVREACRRLNYADVCLSGWVPIEVWDSNDVGLCSWHIGHPITEVEREGEGRLPDPRTSPAHPPRPRSFSPDEDRS